MTTTPPSLDPAPPPSDEAQHGPRATREEVRDLGRIRRTVGHERKVAGVAGGLARHLDIDPIILRVAFVVLVFFGGSGLLLYGAAWLLVPEDGAVRAPLSLDERSRSIALVVVGAVAALLLLGDSIGQFDFPWPLVVIGGIALVVLVFLDRDRAPRPTAPPVPHQPDPATGAFVPAQPGQWTPPPAAYRPPPRNPRKRGPILFWFALLASVVLVATLGVLDLAGVDVAPAAYPASVLATCGVLLLVGAFWGRAGGLILLGLVAALVTGVTASASTIDPTDVRRTPTTAAAVDGDISIDAGEIQLDLTDVSDLAALDGRTLDLDGRFATIEVYLPPGLSATVDAHVRNGGQIELFGSEYGGFGVHQRDRLDAGPGTPEITIDADLAFGEIRIVQEEAP